MVTIFTFLIYIISWVINGKNANFEHGLTIILTQCINMLKYIYIILKEVYELDVIIENINYLLPLLWKEGRRGGRNLVTVPGH